jgi:hypothetical protein
MTKHTPGPWTIAKSGEHIAIRGNPQTTNMVNSDLARCGGPKSWLDESEVEANASLIAAAPDLLAACREILRIAREEGGGKYDFAAGFLPAFIAADKAVDKAEGRAQ